MGSARRGGDITIRLAYAIKLVADMDRAVRFFRDTLGLPLKFQSPGWSEFTTGDTTLALHVADPKDAPGTVTLGFNVPDLQAFYEDMTSRGVKFTLPPTDRQGVTLAQFLDADGAVCSVGQERKR
jgi:lactoylglutathione lyase